MVLSSLVRRLTALCGMLLIACSASVSRADATAQERLASEEAVDLLHQQSESTVSRRSTGAMVVGIVMTSVGFMGVILAGVSALSNSMKAHSPSYATESQVEAGVAIGGGLIGLAGIPLIVYGAQRKPETTFFVAPGVHETGFGLALRGSF